MEIMQKVERSIIDKAEYLCALKYGISRSKLRTKNKVGEKLDTEEKLAKGAFIVICTKAGVSLTKAADHIGYSYGNAHTLKQWHVSNTSKRLQEELMKELTSAL